LSALSFSFSPWLVCIFTLLPVIKLIKDHWHGSSHISVIINETYKFILQSSIKNIFKKGYEEIRDRKLLEILKKDRTWLKYELHCNVKTPVPLFVLVGFVLFFFTIPWLVCFFYFITSN
jgi:hypothetical protein